MNGLIDRLMIARLLPVAAAAAVVLLWPGCSRGPGGLYHVAPDGDDDHPGTRARPFRTIQKAAEVLAPGEVCVVHPGLWRETVRPARAGEAGRPIRFVAAGAGVVLTGLEPLDGWKQHEGAIYRTRLESAPQAVFVGGEPLSPARHPNAGPDPFEPPWLDLVIAEGRITGPGLDQPQDFWKDGFIWGLDNRRGWVAQRRKITRSEPGAVYVDATVKAWWSEGGARAWLTGVLGALDAPGEWHHADGWLYVWLPDSRPPGAGEVAATRRRFGFDLEGLAHIELAGFELLAASINLHKATHCVVDGLRARWVSLDHDMAGGFNRDHGIGPDSQGLGIVLGGAHNVVRNSIISHNFGDGISMFGASNTVENCIVHDCNYAASDCAPITATGVGHLIRGNTLHNAARSILVHRRFQAGKILHNHMYNAGLICDDLGMTYTYQTDGQGTEIAYNRIHHNFARGWGCVGIYLDDASRNHLVHHNLVYQVSEAIALNPPDSRANLIFNNTLDGFRASIGMGTHRPQDMTGTRIFNNIFTGRVPRELPGAAVSHNITREMDPKFVDRARRDYRLQPDSPAIDAGRALPPHTDGFTGAAPDCGAFEHGRPAWTAGSTLRPPEDLRDIDLGSPPREKYKPPQPPAPAP
jgi:parallel beta-helix repeat protein